MTEGHVALALFDLLDEYSSAIASGKVPAARAAPRASKAITFMQSFFEQLFAACFDVQIEAFDETSKRLSVELRHGHGRDIEHELRPLISAFEEACDFYPDIIGASYGGGSVTTFKRFHKRFLPRLLRSTSAWAAATNQQGLRERVETSQHAYEAAIREAKW